MQRKVYLCTHCQCCPAVEFRGKEVHIGEDANRVVLKREEWNILVKKIRAGELKEL